MDQCETCKEVMTKCDFDYCDTCPECLYDGVAYDIMSVDDDEE